MVNLINAFISKQLLPGISVNATWDLIKSSFEKINQKSLEDFFYDAFQQAIKDYRPHLTKYATEDGEISIDDKQLRRAIQNDFCLDLDDSSLDVLTDDQFLRKIAKALEARQVLIIGGHNLSEYDYAQLVNNLVNYVHTSFKSSILNNEQAFREFLLQDINKSQAAYNTLISQQTELQELFQFQSNNLNLDSIESKVDIIWQYIKDNLTEKEQKKSKPDKIRIYLAAPGDVNEEKKRIKKAIQALRNQFTDSLGVALELLDYDSLDKLEDCDIFIGILWLRFEDNTGGKESGTQAEFKAICDYLKQENIGWHQGIIYRCSRNPKNVLYFAKLENATAFARVNEFFNSYQQEYGDTSRIEEYEQPEDLGISIYDCLYKWLRELIPTTSPIPEIKRQDLDFRNYYQAIQKRYRNLDLTALTPPTKDEFIPIELRTVFVEQEVREEKPPQEIPKELSSRKLLDPEDFATDQKFDLEEFRRERQLYTQKPPQPVLDAIARHKYTVILGDPGSGKSTLARYVLLSLINPTEKGDLQIAFDNHLPLLVELREYVGYKAENRLETFLKFFDYRGKNQGWGLTETGLEEYLNQKGQSVIIFDGLDEIFNSRDREEVMRQIVGFTIQHPQVKVIVTSRIVGYDETILKNADFTHFTLQDLEKEQVETFIERWYGIALSDQLDEAEKRRNKVMTAYQESASIRLLAGNPMLLTIMAIIGKHQELPRERCELYEHAASVLMQHWDVKKQLQDENIDPYLIREKQKKDLLRRLAYRMQKGAGGLAGNYISEENIQAEFRDYFQENFSWNIDRATKNSSCNYREI